MQFSSTNDISKSAIRIPLKPGKHKHCHNFSEHAQHSTIISNLCRVTANLLLTFYILVRAKASSPFCPQRGGHPNVGALKPWHTGHLLMFSHLCNKIICLISSTPKMQDMK